MLIKDDKKDLFFFSPPSESPNEWQWGQGSYPKCIVDVETITELIVLPAAITSKINEPETTKAAHRALLEMRLKRITLIMTILGYYCTSKWEYFLLHLLVQTQTRWRSQPHPQQPIWNPGNDSRHLKVSVPLPKSLFPGLFSGKMRNNSQDSEMPPSLPFAGEIPVLLLQFWPSVSNFWQEVFSRFVPQIGLKYFFFQPSTTESPIARILKHSQPGKGHF